MTVSCSDHWINTKRNWKLLISVIDRKAIHYSYKKNIKQQYDAVIFFNRHIYLCFNVYIIATFQVHGEWLVYSNKLFLLPAVISTSSGSVIVRAATTIIPVECRYNRWGWCNIVYVQWKHLNRLNINLVEVISVYNNFAWMRKKSRKL